MANDTNKNAANTPKADAPANAAGSATPNPTTPDAPLSPNTTTPGVGDAAAKSAASKAAPGSGAGSATTGSATTGSATGSDRPRPVTTAPGAGDPTVDRLSLDPADSDDWVTRTKLWVEENPALAVAAAVGLGLLVGRIVTMAWPEPEPETLTGKIEKRAHELAKQGRYVADDAGDAIARQLAVAADALAEASGAVAKNAKRGYSEAKDFSETIAEAIGQAFSQKASSWIDRLG